MNRYLFDQINGLAGRSAFADHLMIDAAKYLIALVFLAAAVLVLLALRRRRLVEVAYFGAALALSYGIAVLFQHLVFERRPFENPSLVVHQLVAHAGGTSFPSDHAVATFAIGAATWAFLHRAWGIALFACGFVIGFARVFVGIHYPGDIGGSLVIAVVVVGALMGVRHLADARSLGPVRGQARALTR